MVFTMLGLKFAGDAVGNGVGRAGRDIGSGVGRAGHEVRMGINAMGQAHKDGLIRMGEELNVGMKAIGCGISEAGYQVGRGVIHFGISAENASKHLRDGMLFLGVSVGAGIFGGLVAVGYANNPEIFFEPFFHAGLYSSAAMTGLVSHAIATAVYPQLLEVGHISNKLTYAVVSQLALTSSEIDGLSKSLPVGTVVGVFFGS
ncbi:UNVERIFIED_CONTAM: hypothetical protein HDU68_011282 [Siphonaria sp. JEL0065]|nr:hypothetical protein HDU68_011282 [Siphonaria sp. JEL0065]